MDGFFASVPLRPIVDIADENVDRFAQAIAGRFNNSDRPLLTARLTPTHTDFTTPVANRTSMKQGFQLNLPATPLSRMSLSSPAKRPSPVSASPSSTDSPSSSNSDFTVATASSLSEIIRTPRILILDIRPHSAYATARLPHAISLSVPSTLLKRPAFTLQKLSTMLSSSVARSRFQTWTNASRILVYDADSAALNEGSNLLGLLRKFRAEGFTGDIAWLKGGIQALWRDHRYLVDEANVSDDEEEGESPKFLRARNLPQTAFQQASTTTANTKLSRGSPSPSRSSSRPSTTSSPSASKLAAVNPFYDNIRQNIELSQGITERIPLKLSPKTASRAQELPFAWLRDIAAAAGRDEGAEALAMQFYRIELGEQRRLQGVMAHHSRQPVVSDIAKHSEQENVGAATLFPYSILAGVEKGTKNRYRNIWPFEHSRVRLKDQEDDDYVNASFVQPLGTRRQYIATQGPLPSTFADFWSIVWEQNVSVIVMLTREFEGGSVKCGNYWSEGNCGPYRLKRLAINGAKEEVSDNVNNTGGDFFDAQTSGKRPNFAPDEHNNTIHRVFELSHSGQPLVKPRIIHHIQYLGWPDMDVPVSPKGLLRLMFEVDELVDAANEGSKISPPLLHCSAGVGRTGAFIAIDAVLDGIRREIRRHLRARKMAVGSKQHNPDESSDSGYISRGDSAMEIDSSSSRAFSHPPSLPPSDHVDSIKSPSSSLTPIAGAKGKTEEVKSLASHPKDGPTATLHMGGPRGPDIHVPLVPSSASPTSPVHMQTPKPSKQLELILSPVATASAPLQPMKFGADPAYSKHRQSLFARRVLNSDFSIADADSMFTNPSPNSPFATDVDPMYTDVRQVIQSSSSSGEGNMSGGDRGNASSGSGSGSGSGGSYNRRIIQPVQQALAQMSSGDDRPGSMDRLGHDSFPMPLQMRMRESGSRSGSGESGNDASGSSSSVASGGGSGGYSSSSSLGLRRFEALCTFSPDHGTMADTRPTSKSLVNMLERTKPALTGPPDLVAPQPVHPFGSPVNELMSSAAPSHVASALPPRLKSEKLNSSPSDRSNLSSSSLPSSSTEVSSIHSTRTSTSETALSTHELSMHGDPPSPASSTKSKDSKRSLDDSGFDYKAPRELHGDSSPPFLSSLKEPIRQILEDMREQRMSLCQSLRQYVFVHNAVIEGALLIINEERVRAGLSEADMLDVEASLAGETAAMQYKTGKRGASPTELTKEDKMGEVALAKRPSVKRGKSASASSSESTGS